jgi:hypothetical protein
LAVPNVLGNEQTVTGAQLFPVKIRTLIQSS